MRNREESKVVTLKELWAIFVQHLWVLGLIAVAAAGITCLASRLTYVPAYSSTATLYILRQNSDTDTGSSDSDFSLALKVVSDCDYLLKSHSVLDEVIQTLGLDTSYDQLSRKVSISNPDNTRILKVTVQSDTPEKAKQIVDMLCEIGQEKIMKAMGFQQVNLYEYGTFEPNPCNTPKTVTCLMVGVAAAVLAYAVFLIAFLLDDRIRTDEDVERYLGLSILGDIPDANDTKNRQGGYYTAYGAQPKKQSGRKRGK